MSEAKVCGRCGVYRHIHPTPRCDGYRPSFWWDRHTSLVRHVAGAMWLALPQRWRWAVVYWYHERHPNLCWCELVDAAMLDGHKRDYRKPWGCSCDVPLPTSAREPRAGECYCPAEVSR